jgi:hypothetical protein
MVIGFEEGDAVLLVVWFLTFVRTLADLLLLKLLSAYLKHQEPYPVSHSRRPEFSIFNMVNRAALVD